MERLTWECELDGFTDIGLRDGVTVDAAICRLAAIEDILGDEYDLDELSKAMAALRREQE